MQAACRRYSATARADALDVPEVFNGRDQRVKTWASPGLDSYRREIISESEISLRIGSLHEVYTPWSGDPRKASDLSCDSLGNLLCVGLMRARVLSVLVLISCHNPIFGEGGHHHAAGPRPGRYVGSISFADKGFRIPIQLDFSKMDPGRLSEAGGGVETSARRNLCLS